MTVNSFLSQRERLLKIAFVAALVCWPLLFRNDFVLSLMTLAGIYASVVLGLVVLTGQAGQLSFGHAAFFGIGAYTSALLATRLQVPTLLALLAGAAVAGLVALLVGRPVLRLRYFFLAVATIGLVQIFTVFARETRALTGGANGLGGIPPLSVGPFAADGYLSQYYVAWAVAFGLLVFARRALASRFGRALRALAASEVAAATLGIRVANWKLLAFVVSAVYAGLAGGLFAFTLSAINPNDFGFGGAIVPVIMLLVGGAGSLWGALFGTILMTLTGRAFSSLPEYSGIFYAVILLLLLLFLPEGLAGGLHAGHREWLRGRFAFLGRAPAASPKASARGQQPRGGEPPTSDGALAAAPATRRHDGPAPRAPGAEPLLRIEGVSVSFGGLKAVNEVSLTILEGQIKALIGPNGAGKTTCFNVISGLQPPSEGRLWFAGQDVTGRPPAEIARLGMARTFQNLRIFGNMTALENVLAGRHRHERAGLLAAGLGLPQQRAEERLSRARAMEALALVGLAERADAPAASLPYGQQRLVEIARALATEPRLLLLDEPAAGMNATERAHLIEQIVRIRDSGVTVLLVEHDIHMVMGLSDAVSVLDYGRLIASGEPEAVQKHPAVIEAYLGVPQEDLQKHPAVVEMYESVEHGLEPGAHGAVSAALPEPPVEPAQRLLEVSGLSTYYGAIQAVREVSFTVPAGEIVAILGANGAGKTTLLRTISGVLRPRSGKVVYDGADLTRLPPAEIVARGVCQVPEGRQIFSTLNVADNLTLGASGRRERGDLSQDLAFVYELFPILAERRAQLAGTLSGGQQQMLAMGRALLGRPRLLLLDEPSMGLAPLVVEQIFEALQKLNQQGLTILMVEQYAEMALEVAHRAIVLQTGQVALAGSAAELRRDDRVRELYLGH